MSFFLSLHILCEVTASRPTEHHIRKFVSMRKQTEKWRKERSKEPGPLASSLGHWFNKSHIVYFQCYCSWAYKFSLFNWLLIAYSVASSQSVLSMDSGSLPKNPSQTSFKHWSKIQNCLNYITENKSVVSWAKVNMFISSIPLTDLICSVLIALVIGALYLSPHFSKKYALDILNIPTDTFLIIQKNKSNSSPNMWVNSYQNSLWGISPL